MTAKYRVIGRQTERPKRFLGVYSVPDEAIWLIEDIATLEIMQQLLDRLQDRSFVECDDLAKYEDRLAASRKVLRRIAFLIGMLQQIANKNLTHDYLGGEKIPRRPNRQTINDVLNLLREGFKL